MQVTPRENPGKTITTPVVTPQGGIPTKTITVRDIESYPIHSNYERELRRYVGSIVSRPISRAKEPLKMLLKPKDKDPVDRKSGAMYWYRCGELTCDEEYIGETSRTFGERCKEHLKEPHSFMHTAPRQDTTLPLRTLPL